MLGIITTNILYLIMDSIKITDIENLLIENLEKSQVIKNKKILIIYTGGTIGMEKSENGYIPKANFLYNYMLNHPNFCDKSYTEDQEESFFLNESIISNEKEIDIENSIEINRPYRKKKLTNCSNVSFKINEESRYKKCLNKIIQENHNNNVNSKQESNHHEKDTFSNFIYSKPSKSLFSPINIYNKRIEYQIVEFIEKIDSSNCNLRYWNMFGTCIYELYSLYDGFIVLHGTDTMSYTASALSFMFENLNKTVIITGSQIPLAEMCNDALSNLLDAINICGTFHIPEVTILFRGQLLRGNRCIKNDSRGLNAFESPNYGLLIELGTVNKVNWHRIMHPPSNSDLFSFSKFKDKKILIFKFFPTITDEAINIIFNQQNIDALIIETYGSGNLPSNRESLLGGLLKMSKSNIIMINVSQCRKGITFSDYEVGKQLEKIGLIYAFDMTVECSLCKLIYLLSKGYSKIEIKTLFEKNLRGELTERKKEYFSFFSNNLINSIRQLFIKDVDSIDQIAINSFLPSFVCDLVSNNKIDLLKNMKFTLLNENKNINEFFNHSNSKFPLHIACERGNLEMVNLLLEAKFDINIVDDKGRTLLYYACMSNNSDICKHLILKGIKRKYGELDGSYLCELAVKDNLESIKLFYTYYNNEILTSNYENRNISHISAILKRKNILFFLKNEINFPFYTVLDIYNKSAYDYCDNELKEILIK